MRLVKILIIIVLFSVNAQAQEVEVWPLQKCVDYALKNNLTVERSAIASANSELAYKQAQMSFLPDLNGNSSYGVNYGRSIDPTTNQFVNQTIQSARFSASSNLTVFSGLSLQNNLKQNRLAFEASKKDMEVNKNDVIINIVSLYLNVLFAKEQLENAKQQLATTEKQVRRTRIQVEAGALPKSNLLDIEAQNATNDFNLVSRENDVVQAKIQLKQAMQLPPESSVEIDVPEIDVDANPVLELTAYEIYQIALNNMPEVESADLYVESADMGVKVAKGDYYPSISLFGDISTNYSNAFNTRDVANGTTTIVTQPIGYVDVDGTPQTVYTDITRNNFTTEDYGFPEQFRNNVSKSFGVGISIPVFNRFSTRFNVQRAELSLRQAEVDQRETKYMLWTTIEQSYNDVLAAAKSYNASQLQVSAREEAFRVTNIRFENGGSNFVDYQIAESQFFQAKSDLLRAKYDLIFKQKILDFYQGKTIDL